MPTVVLDGHREGVSHELERRVEPGDAVPLILGDDHVRDRITAERGATQNPTES